MVRAYILINTDVGVIEKTQEGLRAIPGVREADIVAGEHDLVVVVEAPTERDIGRLIMRDIQGVAGVASTTTYMVVS